MAYTKNARLEYALQISTKRFEEVIVIEHGSKLYKAFKVIRNLTLILLFVVAVLITNLNIPLAFSLKWPHDSYIPFNCFKA